MSASISSTTGFMAGSLANRPRRCEWGLCYLSGGAARGALAGRLLDRRQRRRDVLQGPSFGPHPEHQFDDGGKDQEPGADEVKEIAVREPPLPLFAKVAEQGGLAHVIYGQHPHEVAVLHDGQGPEAALLQDAVAICEEVGVGRDGWELGLHQVADGIVAGGGVGCGHDLVAGDDTNETAVLVENGEVLLVAVDDGVEDLAEVVVRRYGLSSALGTHHVGDGEPAHLLPLADHLGLAARAEEDEEADDGEQEVVAEEPEEDKEDGEALSYGRRDIRGTHGPEARGEQPAQHTATVHREGRDQVEDHERDVDSTQRGEDLAQRSYAREYIRRDRDVAPEEQGKPEEYRGEHYVDERPRYGDLHLVDGSLWQRLHPGKPAYGQERDVLDLAPEAYGHQRVAVLVEQ